MQNGNYSIMLVAASGGLGIHKCATNLRSVIIEVELQYHNSNSNSTQTALRQNTAAAAR